MDERLSHINEPENYYFGLGERSQLEVWSVLLFVRRSKMTLQQEALQDRSHHRLVLVVNQGTSGTVHLDELEILLHPGQACLVFPYQFHHFSHLAERELRWVFCTFEVRETALLEVLRNRVVDLHERSLAALQNLLQDWVESEGQGRLVQAALLYLLETLLQDAKERKKRPRVRSDQKLISAINGLLADKQGVNLQVVDLAERMGYSASRLRALFRKEAGVPLGAYVRNYCLNRAMDLLETTDYPVATVAKEAGFGSVQSFCRVFRKEVGSTPRAYRLAADSRGAWE